VGTSRPVADATDRPLAGLPRLRRIAGLSVTRAGLPDESDSASTVGGWSSAADHAGTTGRRREATTPGRRMGIHA
jgi:hypothetical protein